MYGDEGDVYSVIDNARVGKFQRRLAVTAALGPFTDAFNEFGSSVALVEVGELFHLQIRNHEKPYLASAI